jgi:hypothetical protein
MSHQSNVIVPSEDQETTEEEAFEQKVITLPPGKHGLRFYKDSRPPKFKGFKEEHTKMVANLEPGDFVTALILSEERYLEDFDANELLELLKESANSTTSRKMVVRRPTVVSDQDTFRPEPTNHTRRTLNGLDETVSSTFCPEDQNLGQPQTHFSFSEPMLDRDEANAIYGVAPCCWTYTAVTLVLLGIFFVGFGFSAFLPKSGWYLGATCLVLATALLLMILTATRRRRKLLLMEQASA